MHAQAGSFLENKQTKIKSCFATYTSRKKERKGKEKLGNVCSESSPCS